MPFIRLISLVFLLSVFFPAANDLDFIDVIYNNINKSYYKGEEIIIEAKVRFPKEKYTSINKEELVIINSIKIDTNNFYINNKSKYLPSVLTLQGLASDSIYYYKTIFKASIYPDTVGFISFPELLTKLRLERYTGKSWSKEYKSTFGDIDIINLSDSLDSHNSGILGTWNIEIANLSDSLLQDVPYKLDVVVSGRGNPNSVYINDKNFLSSLDVIRVERVVNPGDGLIDKDRVDFSYTFVPKKVGNIEIPEFSLVYFDAKKNIWKKKTTKMIEIKVVKESNYNRYILIAIPLIIVFILYNLAYIRLRLGIT